MKLIVISKRKTSIFSLFIFLLVTCTLFATFVYAENNRNNHKDSIALSMNDEISKNERLNLNKNILLNIPEENALIEATLIIPKLKLKYSVFSNVSDELLKTSVCKLWGPEANKIGNYVIVGNNDDEIFGKLYTLSIGDTLELSDLSNEIYTYKIYDIYVTKPDDITSTSQLTDGKREITLITTSNNGTQRLVVKCEAV